MKVKLKKLKEEAHIPTKGREGDFCYDVLAVSEEEIAPNVWKYGLGFAYEIDRGGIEKYAFLKARKKGTELTSASYKIIDADLNISIDLRPRSSIWKTGMVLANSEGTMDEFYRNEAMAVFYHVMPNMPRYKVGDRVGQIKLGFTVPMEFEWANDINMNTERGTGGFGSTGK